MKALRCIGGPYDGELIANDGEWFTALMPQKVHDPDAKPEWVQYNCVSLGGEHERFFLWAVQGMTGDQIIQHLIDNYRPS